MWENHTAQQLKDGKSSFDADAGRDGLVTHQLRNNAAFFGLKAATVTVLAFLWRQGSSYSSKNSYC